MQEKISFKINGESVTLEVDPEWMLIDVIREQLDLSGTKRGCDNSTCGACTVVINGKATKSCNTAIRKVAGAEILTVEGLSQGRTLHPVQRAITQTGAIQCGYCTPGVVMEVYALLESNPNATQQEIFTALNKHLCRCTGYEPIRDGALLAQKLVQQSRP